MDPIRNTGTASPRDISPEPDDSDPHDAEPRRVRRRTTGAFEETVPLTPLRRAMSGDMEAGPSSRPPRSALPHMNAAPPSSPQPEMPRLAATVQESYWPAQIESLSPLSGADLPLSVDGPDDSEDLLAEFGISGEPQPADVFRLVEQVAQRPNLESRILCAAGDLLMMLDCTSELRDGIESRFGLSAASDRVITELLHLMRDFAETDVVSDEIDGLEADLAQQRDPLGSEIQAWVQLTGEPIESAHAFDDEDNANSFARLLARLRGPGSQGTSAAPEQTAAQVSSVIKAIANDADLRTTVFSLAQDALGSCGDNLAEGFSKIRLAVDNHRMTRAVESGQVNAKQLNDWTGSLFRLSLLESVVHRFIHTQLQRPDLPELQRNALMNEPLETMVHAKVALRKSLALPKSTAAAMEFRGCSVLGQRELSMLALQVKAQAEDRQTRVKFMLSHQTWRAGMKALHAQDFKTLKLKRDNDPFFDLDVPPDLEGQAEYAAEARRVEAKYADEENALLLRLAAEGG